MSTSPQHSSQLAEKLVIGLHQHDLRARTRAIVFIFTPLSVVVLAIFYYLFIVKDLMLAAYLVLLPYCAVYAGYLIYQSKKGAYWIEGGDYAEYCKGETVCIYYKDIVSWSAEDSGKTTITDGAQSIVIKDGLAFPHLFRYLADNGIPAEASSSVQNREYLEEQYQKSRERAVAFLNAPPQKRARK